jgi:DNA adenine methylase
MQKPRELSTGEVYNDIDQKIVTVMRVLRDQAKRERLQELLALTPFAREEFDSAWADGGDDVELARLIFIRSEMGFGSAGLTRKSSGFRCDVDRAYSNPAQIWAKLPERITQFTDRLRGVLIENMPAMQVIDRYDGDDVLFYLDPPYVACTRNMGKSYDHEMTDSDHVELLARLKSIEGMAVISGYPSDLYDDSLAGWARFETTARIAAGKGTKVRKEVLWMSPAASDRLNCNYGLF